MSVAQKFPDKFLSTSQLDPRTLDQVLTLALQGKRSNWQDYHSSLARRVAGLMFFNPSLRTRASFQSGIARLGGASVVLGSASDIWQVEFKDSVVMDGDKAEHVREMAKVLDGYFDLVGVRSFAALKSWQDDQQDSVLLKFSTLLKKPLVNMESAMWHPCQALADALTLRECFGSNIRSKKFVLSWVNHPRQLPMAVPNSALVIAAQLGMQVCLACPKGYELSEQVLELAQGYCRENGAAFEITHSQETALRGAHVVYAKSWTPPAYVGKEGEELAQRANLGMGRWIIDRRFIQDQEGPAFMHCLPARRNVVVSDEVIDGPTSLVGQQAENRMHAQNALMLKMLGAV